MSERNKVVIGIMGFGNAGEEIYRLLKNAPGLDAEIKMIYQAAPEAVSGIESYCFTTRPETIIDDPEINVVVELMNDAEEVFTLVARAMKSKKVVIGTSKKIIAEKLQELLLLQKEVGIPFFFEGVDNHVLPLRVDINQAPNNRFLQDIEEIRKIAEQASNRSALENFGPYKQKGSDVEIIGRAAITINPLNN